MAVIDGWVEVVLRTDFRSLEQDWEDLRQEIRIRVLRNLKEARFHGDSELRTYVHRIAKNAGIDYFRRAARRRVGSRPGAAAATEDDQAALISRDLLGKILAALPVPDRDLLELIHGQHLSYAEIAHRLGVAEGTVKARVFRCRERMLELRRRLLEVRHR